MLRKFTLGLLAVLLVCSTMIFTGCGNSQESKIVGTYHATRYFPKQNDPNSRIEQYKSIRHLEGNNYLITYIDFSVHSKKIYVEPKTWTLKGDVLERFGDIIQLTNDGLIDSGLSYKKISNKVMTVDEMKQQPNMEVWKDVPDPSQK